MSSDETVGRALAVLASLRLADDRRWGDLAVDQQWRDAEAILDRSGPRRHWVSRARGFSKTGDVAGVAVAAMLSGQFAAGDRLYAAAGDADQAGLLRAAIGNYVLRTPELQGELTVQQSRVIANRTGVVLEVLSADAASSYGLLPAMLLIDELCQWPRTGNAREFYTALTSALPKVPGARSVVLTTAGDPSHWSKRVYDQAVKSPLWRVSEVHGPAPWQNAEEIEEQRASLMPSMFERLFENRWTASEDRLVDPADLDAAVTLAGPQDPVPGARYVVGVDLGLRNDRTAVAVAHRRRFAEPGTSRIVLDELLVWQGSRDRPLDVGMVERAIVELVRKYNDARVVADPSQAEQLLQNLKSRRIMAERYVFSAQSVGRLALTLFSLLKARRVDLPPDDDLLDELANVRLRETSPGVFRMDHDSNRHDDRAIAISLAAHQLLSGPHRPRVKPGLRATSYI